MAWWNRGWFIATLAAVASYKDNDMPGLDAPERLRPVLRRGGGSKIVGMIPFGIYVGFVLLMVRSQLQDP